MFVLKSLVCIGLFLSYIYLKIFKKDNIYVV